MAKIFVSHSSNDSIFMNSFIGDFLERSLKISPEDIYLTSREGQIGIGEDFITDITKNITDDCKIVLLMISENYFNSPFCISELGASWVLAKLKNIEIIPLILPLVDTKQLERTPLKNLQYKEIKEENLSSIIDEISKKGVETRGTTEINKRVTEFGGIVKEYRESVIKDSKKVLENAVSSIFKAFDEKKWGKAKEFSETIQGKIIPIIVKEKYDQLVNEYYNNETDETSLNRIWVEFEKLKDEFGNCEDAQNIVTKIHPVIRSYTLLANNVSDVRVKTKLNKLADPNTSPTERKYIGDELATLNDVRKGVGVLNGLPDIDWVNIPSGDFLFGAEKKKERVTQDYKISRYLVTNAQFGLFTESEDYKDDYNWIHLNGINEQIRNPNDYKIGIANYPIVNISWIEAMAFCNWLSKKMNKNIQIPTHFEWQKAARGELGRDYAYGNVPNLQLGNTAEHNFRSPVAVGLFPLGASPYGLLDISGNVWEWTYTINSAVATEKELEKRVLVGGSYNYGLDRDKVYSYNSMPVNYNSDRGSFRIAMYD
jgi:formylglycine-generating enzyme required for sulfatase activity